MQCIWFAFEFDVTDSMSSHTSLQRTEQAAAEEGQEGAEVKVDDMLTKFLRAHQREGLQFLFDCVTGLKPYDGQGWCELFAQCPVL
jgi:hypothetical protein